MSSEQGALSLLGLRGIGRVFVRGVLSKKIPLNSPDQVFQALGPAQLKNIQRENVEQSWEDAETILSRAKNDGVLVSAWGGQFFPMRLLNIPDSPALIYVLGDASILSSPSIAVIGTRHPSVYGEKSGRKIAHTMAMEGFVVVSGLAEGCDTVAHQGCLDAGGKTVAVLAHGFGEVYPKSNEGLAAQILETGGCLVSEYQPGTPIRRSSFVERDRLQSGLSDAVVVIETDIEGGTMHTVSYAEKQGRILASLRHPLEYRNHPMSRGNTKLIEDGRAIPLENASDLMDMIAKISTTEKKPSEYADQLGLPIG
jgi:DNA processing protein